MDRAHLLLLSLFNQHRIIVAVAAERLECTSRICQETQLRRALEG